VLQLWRGLNDFNTPITKANPPIPIPPTPTSHPHPQVIAQPDERYESYCSSSDFIREYIFPGGHLPR